jgi:uncharacterized membrane protein YidH (DUF202 family)
MSENTRRNNDPSLHLTGTNELDLELLRKETTATFISILASVIVLISIQKSRQVIFNRIAQENQQQGNQQTQQNQQQQSNSSKPTPSEITLLALFVGLVSNLIYTKIAFIRFDEISSQIQAGTTNRTTTPNINIIVGFLIIIIGSLLKITGAIQRINEDAQVTIL